MELVKHTPDEQVQIDVDKASPFAVLVVKVGLAEEDGGQPMAEARITASLLSLKQRADRAKMAILDRSISTNVVVEPWGTRLIITIIGQWAEIEKLEAMRRQQELAGGMPRGRA